MLSLMTLEKGQLCIFMPFQPGTYYALNLADSALANKLQSDSVSQRSSISTFTQTFGGSKAASISKELLRCRYLLDIDHLDRKTQQILR